MLKKKKVVQTKNQYRPDPFKPLDYSLRENTAQFVPKEQGF